MDTVANRGHAEKEPKRKLMVTGVENKHGCLVSGNRKWLSSRRDPIWQSHHAKQQEVPSIFQILFKDMIYYESFNTQSKIHKVIRKIQSNIHSIHTLYYVNI